MKKHFSIAALVLALLFTAGALARPAGAQEAAEEETPLKTVIVPEMQPPVFSLETAGDDSPEMAKKKAALRLFKAYSVTMGQLNSCKGRSSEAGKAASGYSSRNGNTLSLVMSVIKKHGGINPDIRLVLDSEIAAEVQAGLDDCQGLARKIAKGESDLHKAPEFAEDYQLIKAKK